ncbi:hypothetical protein ACVWYG_000642 [Pedobacter sp. UYEF25]
MAIKFDFNTFWLSAKEAYNWDDMEENVTKIYFIEG